MMSQDRFETYRVLKIKIFNLRMASQGWKGLGSVGEPIKKKKIEKDGHLRSSLVKKKKKKDRK